jgi:hypothetical protein
LYNGCRISKKPIGRSRKTRKGMKIARRGSSRPSESKKAIFILLIVSSLGISSKTMMRCSVRLPSLSLKQKKKEKSRRKIRNREHLMKSRMEMMLLPLRIKKKMLVINKLMSKLAKIPENERKKSLKMCQHKNRSKRKQLKVKKSQKTLLNL